MKDAVHYPVRQKGQPRRLAPNQDGIRWLEEASETDTEIYHTYLAGEYIELESGGFTFAAEFKIQRALGWPSAKQKGMYPWPMFQIFNGFKASMVSHKGPCPDCDDWSRTSRCTEHHDRDGIAGLRKGDERRRQRSGPIVVYSDELTGQDDFIDTMLRQFYQRVGEIQQADRERAHQHRLAVRTPCTCSMCIGRPRTANFYDPQADPNAGRPSYHYDFTRDRWTPDDPFILEITGDTVQGPASTVQIEAEGVGNGI